MAKMTYNFQTDGQDVLLGWLATSEERMPITEVLKRMWDLADREAEGGMCRYSSWARTPEYCDEHSDPDTLCIDCDHPAYFCYGCAGKNDQGDD